MKVMDIWTALATYARFESHRLTFRPITIADNDDFFDIAANRDNTVFIFPTVATKEASQQLMVTNLMKEPLGVWGICDKACDRLIGLIRLENLSLENRRAELGYVLNKDYWGQGLMTEAVKTITFLAFQELGLGELLIICHEENRASQRVAQKSGYRLLERYKGSDRYTHKIRQYVKYGLRRGDYRYE